MKTEKYKGLIDNNKKCYICNKDLNGWMTVQINEYKRIYLCEEHWKECHNELNQKRMKCLNEKFNNV